MATINLPTEVSLEGKRLSKREQEDRIRYVVAGMFVSFTLLFLFVYLDIQGASSSSDFKTDFKAWLTDGCSDLGVYADELLDQAERIHDPGESLRTKLDGIRVLTITTALRTLRDFETCDYLTPGSENVNTSEIKPQPRYSLEQRESLVQGMNVEYYKITGDEDQLEGAGVLSDGILVSFTELGASESQKYTLVPSEQISSTPGIIQMLFHIRLLDVYEDGAASGPATGIISGIPGPEYSTYSNKTDRYFLVINQEGGVQIIPGGYPELQERTIQFAGMAYYHLDAGITRFCDSPLQGSICRSVQSQNEYSSTTGRVPSQRSRPLFFIGTARDGRTYSIRVARYSILNNELSETIMRLIQARGIIYLASGDPDISIYNFDPSDSIGPIDPRRFDTEILSEANRRGEGGAFDENISVGGKLLSTLPYNGLYLVAYVDNGSDHQTTLPGAVYP